MTIDFIFQSRYESTSFKFRHKNSYNDFSWKLKFLSTKFFSNFVITKVVYVRNSITRYLCSYRLWKCSNLSRYRDIFAKYTIIHFTLIDGEWVKIEDSSWLRIRNFFIWGVEVSRSGVFKIYRLYFWIVVILIFTRDVNWNFESVIFGR